MESIELTKAQQGYLRWTGGMWSVLKESRKYRWKRRGYLWIGIDVVGIRYDTIQYFSFILTLWDISHNIRTQYPFWDYLN